MLDDLLGGQIPNLNVLKLRLGMALQKNAENGVAVEEILAAVQAVDSNLPRLAGKLGWPFEHLRVIEAYRDSAARYYFATEAETIAALCENGAFEFLGRAVGRYPLAERCPVIALTRR